MQYRVLVYTGLISSLLLLPWWITLCVVVIYCVYYVPAYEIVILGFLADVLYGVPYVYTWMSAVLSMSIYLIRSYVRM